MKSALTNFLLNGIVAGLFVLVVLKAAGAAVDLFAKVKSLKPGKLITREK